MKANELMIGDWVCYSKQNNYCTKVNEIKCTHDVPDDMLYYIKGQRDNRDRLKNEFDETFIVDILSPIPLTPEILEKNGFHKEWDEDVVLMVCDTIIVETGDNYKLYKDGKMYLRGVLAPLYYVHELQHALRLCGIEKEIIL